MSSGTGSGKPTPNEYASFDNIGAPEVFVNDLAGIAVAGQNVHLTFTTFRRNAAHTAGAHVVTLRMVMPFDAFKAAVASMQVAAESKEKN